MAGHSKWSNIKHRKANQDAKRSKLFGRLIREVTVACRMGGEDPASNTRLRLALNKANSLNLPKVSILKALEKGNNTEEGDWEECTYEGYGPHSTAVIVECSTNNRNRTASAIRHAFSKFNGSLGATNSVTFLFERVSGVQFSTTQSEDELFELALLIGADDVQLEPENQMTYMFCSFQQIFALSSALGKHSIEIEDTFSIWQANEMIDLNETLKIDVTNFLDFLNDIDDVQNVYLNFES